MMLDLPELLAPKMRVRGRIRTRWVSAKALKLAIRRAVIMRSLVPVDSGGSGYDRVRRSKADQRVSFEPRLERPAAPDDAFPPGSGADGAGQSAPHTPPAGSPLSDRNRDQP